MISIIGAQLKAAEIRARDRDAAVAAAQAEADGAEQKPAVIYVKRGGASRRAERARLRPGESIYARQPSGEGWAVGVVDANGGLAAAGGNIMTFKLVKISTWPGAIGVPCREQRGRHRRLDQRSAGRGKGSVEILAGGRTPGRKARG
jgi:hypothetical protein